MSAAERGWLARATLVLSALALIPYLLAETAPPPGLRFVGTFWSSFDLAQYLSAMRQGASSASWLIYDTLSPESHAPAFIYPLYVGLGKLAALTGLADLTVLRLAEIVGRALLSVGAYWFAAGFIGEVSGRRLAWSLTFASAGLAPFATAIAEPLARLGAELSVTYVELSSFMVLFATPHLMLGLALTLAALRLATRDERGDWRIETPALAVCVIGLGLTNPFGLLTVLLAVAARAFVGLFDWKLEARVFVAPAAVCLAAAPFLLYYGIVFSHDPFWGIVYGRQNVLPTPSFAGSGIGVGLLLPLACWGARDSWRSGGSQIRSLVIWALASMAVAYAPLPFQRRLLFGIQPALAVLAAPPALALLKRLRAGPARRSVPRSLAGAWLLAGAASISYVALLLASRTAVGSVAPDYFQPVGAWSVAEWLNRARDPAGIVLAAPWDGNIIASGGHARALLAHGVATLDPSAKRADLARFLSSATGETEREAIAGRYCLRYAVDSPRSQAIGSSRPESWPGWQPVFAVGEYTLWSQQPPPSAGAETC